MKPGDVFAIPPGHDSWVIGDEPYVSLHFLGASDYAAAHDSDRSMTSNGRAGAIAYWTLVVVLIAIGALGLLSIGLPFLLLGLMLAIVSQRRHQTRVVATGVAAIVGFMVGYILVAPTSCVASSVNSADGIEHRACTSIIGFGYSGANDSGVTFGLIAGLVVAVLFGLGARWLARRIASRRTSPSPVPA